MIKTLHRHTAQQLVSVFLLAFIAVCVFYVIVDILTDRIDQIVDGAIPWNIVALFYLVELPQIAIQAQLLGLATLIAVLVVFAARARHSELTAALAAGISLRRQATPAILFALVLALVQLAFDQWVAPVARAEVHRYEADYFAEASLDHWGEREAVSWTNLSGGWTCHITKFNRAALAGEEVILLRFQQDREEQIRARRMFWDTHARVWILEDGSRALYVPQPDAGGTPGLISDRITQETAPIIESPEDLFEPFDDPAGFRTSEIPDIIESARARNVPVRPLEIEFHRRFARAALPLLCVLIGVPLASQTPRTGRSGAIGLAILALLAHLILSAMARNLGEIGHLSPPLAAWSASAAFGILAILIARRAPA